MKRLAAFVLSILFLIVPALFGAAAAQAYAQPAPDAPRIRVDVTNLTPRVVTGATTTLSVTGSVTNIGDRRISRPQVRLQIGDKETSTRQLTDMLAGDLVKDAPLTDFTQLADDLEPGQSTPLSVTVNLTGGRLSKPGVYPLLVNVNGTPEFGGQARLGSVGLLLPVLGKGHQSAGPSISLLWPIANSRPRVYSAAYGGPLVLTDDQLAGEMSPNGRLYGLVAAAREAESDSHLANALCFALDPDLLQTAESMAQGYQVHTDSGIVPGKGSDAAKNWLLSLKSLVAGHCTVAMPFADADLNALGSVRSGGTTDPALLPKAAGGADVIKDVLAVTPQPGVLWPASAPDENTLAALPKAGVQTVLTAGGTQETSRGGGMTLGSSGVRAQTLDPLIMSALTGVPANAQSGTTEPATSQPAIATQNGLGALAFRAGLGVPTGNDAGHLLIAPPRRWAAPAAELTAFVHELGSFAASGLVTTTGLPQLLAADPAGTEQAGDGAQELAPGTSADVTTALSTIDGQVAGLVSAMTIDPTKRVKPDDVVAPVRDALVRGTSTAWHGLPADTATANAAADLAAISGRITIEQPKQTIALASGTSPLPVFVSNDLPVGITVRVNMDNNAGLRPEEVQNWSVSAGGGRNRYLPVEALRAGRFTVYVSLSTPAGTHLGSTATFELTSTEYGAVTIIVTIAAGGALLLLASRRIYRRVKDARSARRPSS